MAEKRKMKLLDDVSVNDTILESFCMKFILFIVLLMPCILFAENDVVNRERQAKTISSSNLVLAENSIIGLKETIETLKKLSPIPVLFPSKIPRSNMDHLYASQSSYSDYKKSWIINIDATANCHGAHICNVGSLMANKSGVLSKTYEYHDNGPDLKKGEKEVVQLAKGYIGYFTPGHALADYWPQSLEWQMDGILYTLSWKETTDNMENEKKTMISMVNLAINSET